VTLVDVACGLAILVGLAGIVIPILPGTLLMAVAMVAWAAEHEGQSAWGFAGVALVVLAIGQVVKYLLPGRRLKATVPSSTLLLGGVGAIVGFFVIPIVGALAGFPIGVYVAERMRVGGEAAWPSTKAALRAVGLSIFIEFVAGLLSVAIWLAGVATL
jgi:uncharacterized protein YqgC (DUF456 family)